MKKPSKTQRADAARTLAASREVKSFHCAYCGKPAKARSSTAKYCGNAHKVAAYRERLKAI